METQFTFDEVQRHLAAHYKLEGTIRHIEDGRAENYRVENASGRWLFKIFQPEYGRARVEKAAAFADHLAAGGVACRAFARADDGSPVTAFDDRAAALIPWIDGTTPRSNSLTDAAQLVALGRLCGQIQKLGRDLAGTWTPITPASCNTALERFARMMGQVRDGSELAQEIESRSRILLGIGNELEQSRAGVRQEVIHGDLYCAHTVWSEAGEIVGVIDLMGSCYFPGWELMRCFFQSIPALTAASASALPALWRAYLGGYRAYIDSGRADIERAYDIYLLQLTTSAYGLVDAQGDADLRAFGRWRTATCRFLADARETLRAQMAAA